MASGKASAMAKRKEGPLPEPAEQVVEQFLSELSTAGDRDHSRTELAPLYRALCDLDKAARNLNRQVEKTAREVVCIADGLDSRTDSVAERLKFATLGPMVDALRDRLAGTEPKRRPRKRTKWTLDSALLGGLVTFGNKPSYPFTWPTKTGRRPSFRRLFGWSEAPGPDWLTVFLLYRIIDVWRITTGLWAPSKLADHDIGGDPEKCFHMPHPDSSVWAPARKGRSGRRSPIELESLVAALLAAAPEVGPTLVARRLMKLANEHGIDHPVIEYYRRAGGEASLKSAIKRLRGELRKQRKPASSRRRTRKS
jgi:hypothetical protein